MKKRDNKASASDRKLKKGVSVLLRDHTTDVWDPRYNGEYRIVSLPRKAQVEVVDSTGTTKTVHVSNVKYTCQLTD